MAAGADELLAPPDGGVGSSAWLDTKAGARAVAAPAVGRLGATSPVGEHHSSMTMSMSSINGALTTSSPKLGFIGSDLMMFLVLNSLVTLHQTLSQLGPSGKVPFMYLACLPRRANTLNSWGTIHKGSWCLLQTLLASDRWFQHRPCSMLGYMQIALFWLKQTLHPLSAHWSVVSSSAPLANSGGITCWTPSGVSMGPPWLTSKFRRHICRQRSFFECFAQWKHLMHFPLSSQLYCLWLQEKFLRAILLQTCDLFTTTVSRVRCLPIFDF